jgi:hypothetical protein
MGIVSSRMVSNNLSSLPMPTLQYAQLECHAFKDSNPVRWGGHGKEAIAHLPNRSVKKV